MAIAQTTYTPVKPNPLPGIQNKKGKFFIDAIACAVVLPCM